VYDQIQRGKGKTPVFPRASQNVTIAIMIMRMAPEPLSDEGRRIHKELRDLLEAAAVQQAQSSVEKRHPKASIMPVSSAHGAPEGHPAQSGLRPTKNGVAPGREPSLARSRFVGNHNGN
jgi:hypothetical protein